MRCVITGPPSSGKSTIINSLRHLGFRTTRESARQIITKSRHGNIETDENSHDLQKKILFLQIEKEQRLRHVNNIFFDRAVPDSFSYIAIDSLNNEIIKKIYTLPRYDFIFLLERLPIVDDGLRITDPEKVSELDRKLQLAYSHFGYTPILVPNFLNEDSSLANRIYFILSYVLSKRQLTMK